MEQEKAPKNNSLEEQRFKIARVILMISAGSVILLAAVGFILLKEADDIKYVFASILPLLGTWVGTVLAFYFSGENFESANRNVRQLVDKYITAAEKLEKVKVIDVMIPASKIDSFTLTDELDENTVLLSDLLKFLTEKKRYRLPVLTANSVMKYIVHRSEIDRRISEIITGDAAVENPIDVSKKLTFNDLSKPQSLESKYGFGSGFAVIAENSSLADAKQAMESISDYCRDVIITKSGNKEEPVIGWISNVIITQQLSV